MPTADTLTLDDKVSMLLKGPFGFGKTIAACSAAIDGPLLLAYWDKKRPIELVRFYQNRDPKILKNIDYRVFGAQNAHEFLNLLIDQIKYCQYKTIVVDSITMMTASAVNWSLGFRNAQAGPKKDPLNPQAVMTIPDFDEYKTETSFVTQALDLCRMLPVNVIWTAHPLPKMEITQTGSAGKMSIAKTNSIVTYGSKVAGIIPGQFTEIYHFTKELDWDAKLARQTERRIVHTTMVADEFTKTALGLPQQLDITDKLFWEVWKAAVSKANPTNQPTIQEAKPNDAVEPRTAKGSLD